MIQSNAIKRGVLVLSLVFITPWLLAQKMSNQEYIEAFKEIAMQEMQEHKIPASITLAQGILESGSGNSRLASQGNNHFGIKCKKNWTGRTIIEDDDEKNECFRAYNNAYESYKDHSLFLHQNPRYGFLFDLSILDYRGWAEGLRKAGYATNPRYPQLLIGIIERLNLAQYDTLVFYGTSQPVAQSSPKQVKPLIQVVDNRIPMVVAGKDATVSSVAQKNNMREWQIYKYNDLPKGSRIEPGMVLYIKPKRNRAAVPEHQVSGEETMWEISQKYGIKLKKLYRKNRMEPGTQPAPGEVLSMRRRTRTMPDTGRVAPTTPITSAPLGQAQTPASTPIQQQPNSPNPAEPTTPNSPSIPTHKTNASSNQEEKPRHYPASPAAKNHNGPYEWHVVEQGETLYSIAKKLDVTVEKLQEWNALDSPALYVGQELKYLSLPKGTLYTVQVGDTLFSIAKKFGVTVEDLMKINQMKDHHVYVDQVIQIN